MYRINEITFVRMIPNVIGEEDFKKKMDEVTRKMTEIVKSNYQKEFKGVVAQRRKIDELGENIKRLLKKYEDFTTLEGDCEYLGGETAF